MKAVKGLLLALVAVFPYSLWILVRSSVRDPLLVMFRFWPLCLIAAVILLLTRKCWGGRQLARAVMVIKLIQIPAYVLWFSLGAGLFFLGMFIVAFIVDVLAIILTGLVGLAAAMQCKKEGILTGDWVWLYGILQFIFCIDVISAIILYLETKEVPS